MENNNKIYLGNAFSLQMLNNINDGITVRVSSICKEEIVNNKKNLVSCIGHQDTASVLTDILGFEIKAERINVKLKEKDILYVFQIMGGRLPEGSTTLPQGFTYKLLKVELN